MVFKCFLYNLTGDFTIISTLDPFIRCTRFHELRNQNWHTFHPTMQTKYQTFPPHSLSDFAKQFIWINQLADAFDIRTKHQKNLGPAYFGPRSKYENGNEPSASEHYIAFTRKQSVPLFVPANSSGPQFERRIRDKQTLLRPWPVSRIRSFLLCAIPRSPMD